MRERGELSGYKLIKRIGFGGMSTVYEAESPSGQRVALKRMNPALLDDPHGRQRLIREVRMLQRVSSPHVAQILDVEFDDDVFIVTELIDGPTLEADVGDHGIFADSDLVELAHELVGALRSVHQVGVLHRDIKPSNVMIGPQGIVLIDFGISQAIDSTRLTQPGSLAHTPGYVDPRIIAGEDPDEAADWWALVAVIGFAVSGHPLFHGSPVAIMRQVMRGEADFTGVDPDVARVLRAALAPDLSQRLTIDDFLRALDRPQEFVESLAEEATRVVEIPAVIDETPDFSETPVGDEESTRVVTVDSFSADDEVARTLIAQPPARFSSFPLDPTFGPDLSFPPDPSFRPDDDNEVAEWESFIEHRPVLHHYRLLWVLASLALAVLAGWQVIVASALSGVAFIVFFVIGGLWEHAQARERRGKTGMFPVVIRTPLVLIHAVFMCVIGAVVGGVGGFGSVWFADRLIAHDAAIDIRILFAMAMCVCLILMWQVDWGRMARIGWRVTIRNIAPTSGYYFFWCLIALIALCVAIFVVAVAPISGIQGDLFDLFVHGARSMRFNY
ncbi:serine/threonine-protein kinase [Arcanobacterium buesumense]|uniref:non-specific serine/threonine protein kinase n=1 Tax=Arcanobacterium buesumense TaxID=2722751 RepID=A0A6H2EN23_9ACTO|nr:serine/threonine-protein kinase [Arcanobacterium buesumense]QJC22471.1 serine/threonine protein kinase [Arcanobacterium buesumense]